MRLDLVLKHSGLIKRRTIAKLYCEKGLVFLNGRVAKPSADVKDGDVMRVIFGKFIYTIKVNILVEGRKITVSYDLVKKEDNVIKGDA